MVKKTGICYIGWNRDESGDVVKVFTERRCIIMAVRAPETVEISCVSLAFLYIRNFPKGFFLMQGITVAVAARFNFRIPVISKNASVVWVVTVLEGWYYRGTDKSLLMALRAVGRDKSVSAVLLYVGYRVYTAVAGCAINRAIMS